MDPLVEIMISNGIMIYCVQETWILGNSSTMVRDHMVVMQNINEKEPGSKGRVKGGVATIFSQVAVDAWRKSGSKPPMTTPMECPFSGRFIGVKLSFPKFYKWDRRNHILDPSNCFNFEFH